MKMWKVVAAGARGFLGNCWRKDPIDDGNLKPRMRTRNRERNALNSYSGQVENNANPNKFGINGGPCSSLSSEKEHSNSCSNSLRREVERLTCFLRQKEELIKDLEEELEMRGSWTVKDLTDETHNCLETWRHPLGKGQGQSDTAYEVDEGTPGNDTVKKMENINSIEAELEAELEKLEFNLCSSNHGRNFFGINEIDPDYTADVVNGELREDGLRCNAESEEDNSFSIHDKFNIENFAVSPRDLERRLHEVIISRLQDRIVELETELQAIKLAQKQSDELNQTSQSLNSEISQGPQIAANRIYQASQVEQVSFENGHPSWGSSYSASKPLVQSDSSSTDKYIYNQPSTVPAQGKQHPYHTNSEMASDSTYPHTPPQAIYNQPNSSASSVEATYAINDNKIRVGSACNLNSLLRDKNVVYGEEEADQQIINFETRFSEILNSLSNSANPSSGKDRSPRKLNTRRRGKRGHIKTGLDFDGLIATSASDVVTPDSNKAASTDCIFPCHASVTCSEMDFADISIIAPVLDKFITDPLMDFGMDSEELGSVTKLLD